MSALNPEVYQDEQGQFRFRFVYANGEKAGDNYTRVEDAVRGLRDLLTAVDAWLHHDEPPTSFEYYSRAEGFTYDLVTLDPDGKQRRATLPIYPTPRTTGDNDGTEGEAGA